MYEGGLGVIQDKKEAVYWYTKAAEQGYANAQSTLALMYAKGKGVRESAVYAHVWRNIASSNGTQASRENRDIIAEKMAPGHLAEAQKLARECAKREYKNC